LFGPLSRDLGLIKRIKKVVDLKCFYGNISGEAAQQILKGCGKKGVYLIRFSSQSSVPTITVTVLDDPTNDDFLHIRIQKGPLGFSYEKDGDTFLTIPSAIANLATKFDFPWIPCPGSPFEKLPAVNYTDTAKINKQDSESGESGSTNDALSVVSGNGASEAKRKKEHSKKKRNATNGATSEGKKNLKIHTKKDEREKSKPTKTETDRVGSASDEQTERSFMGFEEDTAGSTQRSGPSLWLGSSENLNGSMPYRQPTEKEHRETRRKTSQQK